MTQQKKNLLPLKEAPTSPDHLFSHVRHANSSVDFSSKNSNIGSVRKEKIAVFDHGSEVPDYGQTDI